MTPKQHANKLIKKFMLINSDLEMFDGFKMYTFYAMRCALITVTEIIFISKHPEYWEEVKKEIEIYDK